jgi:uncharacterized protein (DUF697 family)
MPAKDMSPTALVRILDYCYDAAIEGFAGQQTVFELAEDYLAERGTLNEKIDSLIRWQNAKCATSGFLSGIGGAMTLPISVPADLAACYFVQIRMIGAIAVMRGYDLQDDKVKSLVYLSLCGDGMKEIVKGLGIQVGAQLTKAAISKISGKALIRLNKAVGFRLLTKFGEKGIVNLGKVIPLVGALIGAAVNAYSCDVTGEAAKKIFVRREAGKKMKRRSAA